MPSQSTLMEPPQSKFIINQVELQASLLVTTELLTIDSEMLIKLEDNHSNNSNNSKQAKLDKSVEVSNNYNLLDLPLHQMLPKLLLVARKSKNSQSLFSNNNKWPKEVTKEEPQVLVQDLSPQ